MCKAITPALGLVLVSLVSANAAGQSPPGRGWVEVLPGKQVYTMADSVQRIGPNTFRAGTWSVLAGRSIQSTNDVRCSTLENRGILGPADPDTAWERVYPGSPRETLLRGICRVARAKFGDIAIGARTPASAAPAIPRADTYADHSPERAYVTFINAWSRAQWRTLAAMSRAEYRAKHAGQDAGFAKDYGWGRPTTMGAMTVEQLTAGIARVGARITVSVNGSSENRQVICKLYPSPRGFELDIGHCSMLAVP